jgi:hypothetical protein
VKKRTNGGAGGGQRTLVMTLDSENWWSVVKLMKCGVEGWSAWMKAVEQEVDWCGGRCQARCGSGGEVLCGVWRQQLTSFIDDGWTLWSVVLVAVVWSWCR